MEKYFIITVDTEPDAQWDINAKSTTHNVKFIPRFQKLCEQYGFKPVYLTDYVMASDLEFQKIAKSYLKKGTCEIGMHLHAWDTPPFVSMDTEKGERPYLIEYTEEIMEQKIQSITSLLECVFDTKIDSHRAGRWATNDTYFKLLQKYGYKIDCSVTPHINWNSTKGRGEKSKGTDYSSMPETPFNIKGTNIIEYPVTIRKMSKGVLLKNSNGSIKNIAKAILKNGYYWYRPALFSFSQMKDLYNCTQNDEYIEMMIHSSELMPGGSPYFPTEESIENMYDTMEKLFQLVSKSHKGATLKEIRGIYRKDV